MNDKILAQILEELKGMKNQINQLDHKMDNLETKMDTQFEDVKTAIKSQHIENINSDDLILRNLDEIKESVRFINRKVADTELDLNTVKKALKQ